MLSVSQLQKFKKPDLIRMVRDEFPSYKGKIFSLKKNGLINLYLDLQKSSGIDLETISIKDDIQETVHIQHESDKETIEPWHIKWTEFAMSQFSIEELVNNRPTCDGLRRVFELLIGSIIDANLQVIKPPSRQDQDTTVVWSIRYFDYRAQINKTITEGFNVNPDNTKHPWNLAAVATAATRAEARALRKGLRLQRILSNEEISHGFDVDQEPSKNSPIEQNQKIAITHMTRKLEISISNLLNQLGLNNNLDSLSYEDAQNVILELNNYQRPLKQGGKIIPNEVKELALDI